MPTVFITVDTAINQLAAAKAADSVLVHAAAGGVGLAAMQVIRAASAAHATPYLQLRLPRLEAPTSCSTA